MPKKRFLIERPITSASGTQTFWVDADTEEEALARHEAGEGDIYTSNCEVMGLGKPAIVGETSMDDTGDA